MGFIIFIIVVFLVFFMSLASKSSEQSEKKSSKNFQIVNFLWKKNQVSGNSRVKLSDVAVCIDKNIKVTVCHSLCDGGSGGEFNV